MEVLDNEGLKYFWDNKVKPLVAKKQDKLTDAQKDAVDSGITSAKVKTYDGYAAQIAGKQATLTTAQLAAVNSGVTADAVKMYDNMSTFFLAGILNDGKVIATEDSVSNQIAEAKVGAAMFQGSVAKQADITDYKKGYYWVVGTAGTYFGQNCEIGDMIFAAKDKGTAVANSDFNIVQNNLERMTDATIDAACA